MTYEHPIQPWAEGHERAMQEPPVFDFERMEPDEAVALVKAISAAEEAHEAQHGELSDIHLRLLDRAERSLHNLAVTSDTDKALDIYAALMRDVSEEHLIHRASSMAVDLLRRHVNDPVARLQVIAPLIRALHEGESLAREGAKDAIEELVYAEWLDEPTARHLNDQLPDHSQRYPW
jgi:hypothetical protein